MFYQCPKCKKTWQYPIKKCPHCFSVLEKTKIGKIKVIGVSKVNIPTLLHPNIPYFVLVLEDEPGNKWAQKSTREYKIGEEFKLNTLQNREAIKEAVAIWRIKYDILEAIEKAIDLIGGIKINQDSKVLILPTLIFPKHPYFSENTSPEVLDSLIKYLALKGINPANIKVAAQSFDEVPIEVSAQKSQLLNSCTDNRITPLDLAKGNFVKKEISGFAFEISEEVFNSDLIINLPILKLDSETGVKGATENTLKFLKKESYLSSQYLFGQQELLERLQQVLPTHLTIADGLKIQKSSGFTAFLGLILASFSPLNLDRVFAEITMVNNLPGHLKKIKIKEIPVFGREILEVQYDFEKVT